MKITTSKLNFYMFFKLPAAFWCGVRAKSIETVKCEATVTHKWFNQNPFNSMYFAVQAMAAEFTTGALILYHINESQHNISMLVAQNNAIFTKKAKGKITFICHEGEKIKTIIQEAINTQEGKTIWLKSIGTDAQGDKVSEMNFEWTIKVKTTVKSS